MFEITLRRLVLQMKNAKTERKNEASHPAHSRNLGEFANHPTLKPVNLVADCILDCSNIDGIVVDTFLGSGTSLIASQKTKRTFYGMELEPQYVDSSVRRWIKFMEKEGLDYTVKLNGEIWEG